MQPSTRSRSYSAIVRILAAVAVIAGGNPRDVVAQTTLDQWPGLVTRRLQTVYVRDSSGVETRGRLIGLTPEAVLVLVEGSERRFERADVRKLQTRDSLKNGAWIGVALGVVFGATAAGISDCQTVAGGSCAGWRAANLVAAVGVYTALGTAVDAAIRGRSTLYDVPTSADRSHRGGGGRRALLSVRTSW